MGQHLLLFSFFLKGECDVWLMPLRGKIATNQQWIIFFLVSIWIFSFFLFPSPFPMSYIFTIKAVSPLAVESLTILLTLANLGVEFLAGDVLVFCREVCWIPLEVDLVMPTAQKEGGRINILLNATTFTLKIIPLNANWRLSMWLEGASSQSRERIRLPNLVTSIDRKQRL